MWFNAAVTVVLVHGNPEVAAIWDSLRAELGRDDVVMLSPPGFGAPVPDGFEATADEYRDWLIAELEAMEGPLDLVGHDWGGGHVLRVAAARPDLIRSWCSDVAGIVDPAYEWHDFAKIWQTPGDGEAFVEAMNGMPTEQRAAAFVDGGMTQEAAEACAAASGPEMGRCILALYRSAQPAAMVQWGEELEHAERRPGLVIIATEDAFTGGEEMARRSAERFGAQVGVIQGAGHWWMLQDPAAGAIVLSDFFAGLD